MGRRRSQLVAVLTAVTVIGAALGVVSGSTLAGALSFAPLPDPTVDGAAGSLRAAVAAATSVGGDEIDLTAGGTYTLTCAGGGQLVHGNTPLTISTPSGSPATIRQTCAGARVLSQGTGLLTLNNVMVIGGSTAGVGGGIFTLGGVSLSTSTVSGNTGTGGGGGIFAGDLLSLSSSTVSGNDGGGANGGGIATSGSVNVSNSTVSGNTGGFGGGIFASGSVNVSNSTVSGNTAGFGGGIDAVQGSVFLTNATVTGNTADFGGGIEAFRTVNLVYATVVGNTAPTGANIRTPVDEGPALSSFGSVVALPIGGVNCVSVGGSTGYSWDDDGSCGFGSGPGDHSNGGNPLLGALSDNGGLTQTMLPLAGSGLIDAIPNGACQTPPPATGITTDQRGFARPSPSGGACDIGAVEVQLPANDHDHERQSGPVAQPLVTPPTFTG